MRRREFIPAVSAALLACGSAPEPAEKTARQDPEVIVSDVAVPTPDNPCATPRATSSS